MEIISEKEKYFIISFIYFSTKIILIKKYKNILIFSIEKIILYYYYFIFLNIMFHSIKSKLFNYFLFEKTLEFESKVEFKNNFFY